MILLTSFIRWVEATYKLEIGNAQNTQLAKALASGSEKGIFVLPKGASHNAYTADRSNSSV